MPVFRVEKNNNYTTMCNHHLRDQGLSLKGKGLLSMLLSLPDTWNYSVRGLSYIVPDGVDGVVSTLKELEKLGYLKRRQLRDDIGRLGKTEYVIYEIPVTSPCTEKPYTANPDTDEPYTENPAQLSTNESKTEKINNREKKETRRRYGTYQNVLLSDAEMETVKREFPSDYMVRIERMSEYIASTGKGYKNYLAALRSWARREKPKYSAAAYQYEEGDSL